MAFPAEAARPDDSPGVPMHVWRFSIVLSAAAAISSAAHAQWNPSAGQWGKTDASDLRVMTYNIEDAICSSNAKVEGQNDWCGCARLVAAFKPDVLILEECGDNSGEGTGSGVDSVAELTTTLGYFLHGGTDSFNGNATITAWVQKYAPSYDLPYVFVSSESDGFNRNVILSRYPFLDLNGDGKSTQSDIPNVTATAWAPGGDGQIRGFAFVEIDLPSATYQGNLVVGGAHLKAGGAGTDHTQRVTAAQNVSYVVRYWYNGNGGATPDPSAKLADNPPATTVLDAHTPIVIGGDWNEDELANGATRGPADWLTAAQTVGGTSDGTDRDGTDMSLDNAVNFFTGSDASYNSGDKIDYVAFQDSVATFRHSTIFISGSTPTAAQPPECVGFTGGTSSVTSTASDHRPVFIDIALHVVDCNGNGVADTTDIGNGTSLDTNQNLVPDECECTPTASNYCISAPNSVGPGAVMDSAGSQSIAANNFYLLASGIPPNTAGIFFYGMNATQVVFGNGYRCVGNPVYRLPIIHADLLGSALMQLDFTTPPFGGQISAGQEWRFQLWYRNPLAGGAGFNLSDGRRVRFCP